jgi:hypothetical protein
MALMCKTLTNLSLNCSVHVSAGGLQYRTNNTSPLRGTGGTMHSSSFSYGQQAAGQPGDSNGTARTPSLSGQSTPVQQVGTVRGGELSSIGLPLHRPHGQHGSIADHEGGPGKSHHSPTVQAGAGLNVASAFRPVSSQGVSNYAGTEGQTATAASPGNRSISAARFTQQPSTSYALATPNYNTAAAGAGGEGLTFYDGGRQVTGLSGTANNGAGSPYQHRVSSAHRNSPSGERHRLSGELAGSRPGTSGGLRTSATGSPTSYYAPGPSPTQSPAKAGAAPLSPQYASNGGMGVGRALRADYPSFESYAQTPQIQGGGSPNGGIMTASRPRTSGGVLTSSGGTGRSASHGRSGLYKRRF